MKYVCDVCGWEYDEEQGYPEGGIAPGTKWEDVPEDFECPMCSVGKDQFSAEAQNPAVLEKRMHIPDSVEGESLKPGCAGETHKEFSPK